MVEAVTTFFTYFFAGLFGIVGVSIFLLWIWIDNSSTTAGPAKPPTKAES